MAAVSTRTVQAATLYWDSDAAGTGNDVTGGTGLGGSGTWNNSLSGSPLLNWWPGFGTADQSWVNANYDTAVFSGTAGTVTLTDATAVGGLQFNTTGYTINGATNSKTLTFGQGNETITLNNSAAATITGAVGGAGSVTVTRSTSATSVLTLNGTSTSGWTGATVIDNGATLALSGLNQALVSTYGILLNGSITLTNTSSGEAALDRISNTAAITTNGGTFTVTNTVATGTPYSETIGAVGLTSGLLNVVTTNSNTGGTQVLTLSGLTQTGTAAVAFSGAGGLNTTTNQIKVTGATATTSGQIIGPWATVGTAANAQTDYAVFNGSGNIVAANIASSAETTWTSPTNSYTNTTSGTTTLTGDRSMGSWRYSNASVGTLALAGFNFDTSGILNGAVGGLTISGLGNIRQQGTAAGNVYINTGSGAITINSVIANNTGALTLVKTGTGTLTLAGANTYTGTTIVEEGTLSAPSTTQFLGNMIVGSPGGGAAASFGSTAVNQALAQGITVTVYSNGTFSWANAQLGHVGNLNIFGGTVNCAFGYIDGTITMTGGTLTNAVFGNHSTININASATTANITGSLNSGNTKTFNVADGAAPIDLLVGGGIATGIVKNGAGVMVMAGGNSYTGSTTINAGTLRGTQNSGTPFGTGAIVLNATLGLSPSGSGADVAVTGSAATTGTVFTYGTAATLALNKGSQNSLTYTVGGGGTASLVRSGTGTLVISTSAIGNLGAASSGERFIINGTAPTSISTNGGADAMINTSIVGQDGSAGNNLAGDFLNFGATNGFTVANYSSSTDLNGGTAFTDTRVFNATGATTNALTANTSVLALKNSGQAITGAFALSVGSNSGQAGLIMNGGSIGTTSLSFGAAEGNIYTSSANGAISASLTSNSNLTVFGPGTLTLSGSASTRTGAAVATVIQSGILKVTNANALYNTSAGASGTITANANAAFELSGVNWSAGGTPIPTILLNDNGAALRVSGTSLYSKATGLTLTSGKSVAINVVGSSDTLTISTGLATVASNPTAPLINVNGAGTLIIGGTASNATATGSANNGTYSWDVNGGGKLLVNSTGASSLGLAGNAVKVSNGILGLGSDNTTNYAYTLNGGTLSGAGSGTRTISSASTIALATSTASKIDLKAADGAANMNMIFGGALSGTGSLLVAASGTGAGTLTLSGTSSTFTGPTTVIGAKVLVNGSIASSAVTLGGAGTLGGNGTVGAVSVAAGSNSTISPGTAAGKISTGNFSLNNNNLAIDLSKAAIRAGTQPLVATDYDQVSVTGSVNITGGNLLLSVGNGLENGDIYYIIANDSTDGITGTFGTVNGATPVLGGSSTTLAQGNSFNITANGVLMTFAISYNAVSGTSFSDSITPGNDVALQAISVPEPASMGLATLVAGGALMRRRRKLETKSFAA